MCVCNMCSSVRPHIYASIAKKNINFNTCNPEVAQQRIDLAEVLAN